MIFNIRMFDRLNPQFRFKIKLLYLFFYNKENLIMIYGKTINDESMFNKYSFKKRDTFRMPILFAKLSMLTKSWICFEFTFNVIFET